MEKTNYPYDLILPLPLKHFSLFPRGFSLPKNQSKTISEEKMLVNTTNKRTAMEKVDIAGAGAGPVEIPIMGH